ncbi:innexin inx2 isoform X1 [Eurytemora carolleeae]|nr:innexin inx2 isoform X1 [Eurytemora carolleeae]|eukprot:XP_023322025.1 innexin inx2-like isoform X1 [Eurytemora affinis]
MAFFLGEESIMAELVGAVTKVTTGFLEVNAISIDNWGFKLFYKWTTSLLVFCSVLVTARQFFGSPIQCDAGAARGGIEQNVLESYCWMYSTFNIPREYKGACSAGDQDTNLNTIVYNSYYQWVPLFLIFLAVIFYLPRCLWLLWEGGLMKFFGKGTTTRFIEDQDEKREKLVQFFCRNIHNKYNIYFCGFIFCEFLNFIIVIFQFYLTHRFLHSRYIDYGFKVWQYYLLPPEEQQMPGVINPMCYTFPRIASCDYWRWGTGGQQESINAICILALNIINDKVFLVLWWWFIFVSIISFIRLIYRGIQCR